MKCALSWLLHWLGHQTSKMLFKGEFLCWIFFKPYQRLMFWSLDIQGDGSGPWRKPSREELEDSETKKGE